MTNSIADLDEAEVILVTGSNTTEGHPLIGNRIINAVKERGATLIVVDPRSIKLTRFARYHLKQKCGTDVAWLNGLMHVIIEEGLHDREFIEKHTEGFEEFRKIVEKYTPEYVEQITSIPADDIRQVARVFAKSSHAMIIYSMGITQHTTGVDNVKSTANLAMLTGNIGRTGTGVCPLRGQNNVQGACDMGGLPDVFSGYQKITDETMREKFCKAWNVEKLPDTVGLTVTTVPDAILEGKVRGLYLMGENPLISDPDAHHIRAALEKIDFLVVQDIFLTETAQLAHVVLPGASFAEKDGTFTNTERRVQRVRRAVESTGKSRQDWEIISDIANRSGYRFDYHSPEDIAREISSLTPSYGGITYERLDKGFGLQWPCPAQDHPGTPILHKEGNFTRGKGKFFPIEYAPPAETEDEAYPLTLTTGRTYFQYHTRTMTGRTSTLDRELPESFVEINPADAKKYNVRDYSMVRISSRRGSITVRAQVTEGIRENTLFVPFHFAQGAANVLTHHALDPTAKEPEYKVSAVRLEVMK